MLAAATAYAIAVQERAVGVRVVARRVGQTKDKVREVLRVRVGDDPVGLAERVEEGAVEAQRIAGPQQSSRDHEEERATRGGCEEKEASVAAGGERSEEENGIELEAHREGEQAGSGRAVAALV